MWDCQQGPRTPMQQLADQIDEVFVEAQVQEDTCEQHGIFCCEQCFDMTPVEETS